MQHIEGVKKFFLGLLALGQEVNVVNDQQVNVSKTISEIIHTPSLHAFMKCIHERVATDVQNSCSRLIAKRGLTDGL